LDCPALEAKSSLDCPALEAKSSLDCPALEDVCNLCHVETVAVANLVATRATWL